MRMKAVKDILILTCFAIIVAACGNASNDNSVNDGDIDNMDIDTDLDQFDILDDQPDADESLFDESEDEADFEKLEEEFVEQQVDACNDISVTASVEFGDVGIDEQLCKEIAVVNNCDRPVSIVEINIPEDVLHDGIFTMQDISLPLTSPIVIDTSSQWAGSICYQRLIYTQTEQATVIIKILDGSAEDAQEFSTMLTVAGPSGDPGFTMILSENRIFSCIGGSSESVLTIENITPLSGGDTAHCPTLEIQETQILGAGAPYFTMRSDCPAAAALNCGQKIECPVTFAPFTNELFPVEITATTIKSEQQSVTLTGIGGSACLSTDTTGIAFTTLDGSFEKMVSITNQCDFDLPQFRFELSGTNASMLDISNFGECINGENALPAEGQCQFTASFSGDSFGDFSASIDGYYFSSEQAVLKIPVEAHVRICPESTICKSWAYDETQDTCIATNAPASTVCDDEDEYTIDDHCVNGVCYGTPCDCVEGLCCDGCSFTALGTECGTPVIEGRCNTENGICGSTLETQTTPRQCNGYESTCPIDNLGDPSGWMLQEKCATSMKCDPSSASCVPEDICGHVDYAVDSRYGTISHSATPAWSSDGFWVFADTQAQALIYNSSGTMVKALKYYGNFNEYGLDMEFCRDENGAQVLLVTEKYIDTSYVYNTSDWSLISSLDDVYGITCGDNGHLIYISSTDPYPILRVSMADPDTVLHEYELPTNHDSLRPMMLTSHGEDVYVIYHVYDEEGISDFVAKTNIITGAHSWGIDSSANLGWPELSTDGSLLALKSGNSAKIYETANGTQTMLSDARDYAFVSSSEVAICDSGVVRFFNGLNGSQTGSFNSPDCNEIASNYAGRLAVVKGNGDLYVVNHSGSTQWSRIINWPESLLDHWSIGNTRYAIETRDNAQIRNIETGTLVRAINDVMERNTEAIALSPDGTRLAVTGDNRDPYGESLRILNVSNGSQVCIVNLEDDPYDHCLDYSPDGTKIAVGLDDGMVSIRSASNCSSIRLIHTLDTTTGIQGLAFVDNQSFVSVLPGNFSRWNINGTKMVDYALPDDRVVEVVRPYPERGLLLAYYSSFIGIFDLDSGELLGEVIDDGDNDPSIVLHPTSEIVFLFSRKKMYDWDGRLLYKTPYINLDGDFAAPLPGNRYFLLTDSDGQLIVTPW